MDRLGENSQNTRVYVQEQAMSVSTRGCCQSFSQVICYHQTLKQTELLIQLEKRRRIERVSGQSAGGRDAAALIGGC